MKINVEALIGKIIEHFDTIQEYFGKDKEYKSLEDPKWLRRERNFYNEDRDINDFCRILNIDITKLFKIAKEIRNWEAKRDWQVCFPINENAERISPI